jgi:uncharacterized protein (TIGR03083 family)
MESNPRTWIAALRDSQNDFQELVGPLTWEQLVAGSYHSWTIAEVVKHLGGQSELFTRWLEAALKGVDPPGRESFQPVWDAWDARSIDQIKADGLEYSERLVCRFEGLTDDELRNMRLNLFGIELDSAGLPRFRLTELSIHVWDIAVAFDPSAQIAQPAVDLMVDAMDLLVERRQPGDQEFRLRIQTTNPGRRFVLSGSGGQMRLATDESDQADGELTIPADALIRLFYGRLDPDHTPEVSINGRVSLDDLRQMFPGL